MLSRLTLFRFGAALVIGLAFALWPRDSAYAIGLLLFLLASGAGVIEDVLARRAGADGPGEAALRQAAHRALTLCALVALLLAEPDLAPALAPPLIAALLHDAARASLREAIGIRGARLRSAALSLWRSRLDFVALAALLAAPVLDGPADSALQPLGLALLWTSMVATLWEGWRDGAAALSFLRRRDAPGRFGSESGSSRDPQAASPREERRESEFGRGR
ncbi:MAG: hypothetical protein AAGM38_13190 [Pseudomonadota bacterium]